MLRDMEGAGRVSRASRPPGPGRMHQTSERERDIPRELEVELMSRRERPAARTPRTQHAINAHPHAPRRRLPPPASTTPPRDFKWVDVRHVRRVF